MYIDEEDLKDKNQKRMKQFVRSDGLTLLEVDMENANKIKMTEPFSDWSESVGRLCDLVIEMANHEKQKFYYRVLRANQH